MDTNHCNAQTLAKLLNLSTRHIRQLANDGVLVKVQHGQYDLNQSIAQYTEYQAKLMSRQEKTSNQEIAELKHELLKLQVQEKKLHMDKATHRLVDYQLYNDLWDDAVRTAKATFKNLPDQLAARLQHVAPPQQVYDISETLARDTWNAFLEKLQHPDTLENTHPHLFNDSNTGDSHDSH